MGIPTIGLIALVRVKYVYDQLGILNSYVLLDYEFANDLISKIKNGLAEVNTSKHHINSLKAKSKELYFTIFKELGL